MNSSEQCMNSAKQCVNSEPMWGYCSRAEKKKKKKAENVDVENAECKRYLKVIFTGLNLACPNTHIYAFFFLFCK